MTAAAAQSHAIARAKLAARVRRDIECAFQVRVGGSQSGQDGLVGDPADERGLGVVEDGQAGALGGDEQVEGVGEGLARW